MKRNLFKMIATVSIFVAMSSSVYAGVPPEKPQKSSKTPLKGDMNLDGSVDVKDIKDLANAIIAKSLTAEEIELYDIDGDGKVTIVDLVKAIKTLNNTSSDTTPGISQDPYDGEACAKKR